MPKLGDSLLETHKIITGERQDSYGAPENSFNLITNLWNAYLSADQERLSNLDSDSDSVTIYSLDPVDVANLMILFKVARLLGQTPTRDTYLDIQGYAAIAADILLPQTVE